MVKGNLIKKISQCLGVLAFSTLIGSGICYSKEINQSGYDIPDLSGARQLFDPGYADLTSKIAGEETRIELYQTAKEEYVWKASINDKVFLYQVVDETGKLYAIADTDGDGIFETKYDEKELRYYGEDGVFRKEIPPEWVLK